MSNPDSTILESGQKMGIYDLLTNDQAAALLFRRAMDWEWSRLLPLSWRGFMRGQLKRHSHNSGANHANGLESAELHISQLQLPLCSDFGASFAGRCIPYLYQRFCFWNGHFLMVVL